MKLIQILALATAMTGVAAAQNTGTNTGQQSKPSPTPAGQQKAAKTSPAGPAAKSATGAVKNPVATTKGSKDAKGAVQTGVLPEKKTKTHKTVPAVSASTTSSKVAPQAAQTASGTKATVPAKPAAPGKSATQAKVTAPASKGAVNKPAATSKTSDPAKSTAAAAKTAISPKKAGFGATAAKKPPKTAPPAAAAKVTAKAAGPSTMPEKKPAPRLIGSNGRRDPFVSPIRSASAVSSAQSCTSGKRCLAIPELTLQGTVRDISGKMMAIVATSTHRTYTLRENDQVYNGSVEKITTDSIIFREYTKDALGRENAKEIVKKMGPTS
jgi:hypothetical protein